MRLGPTVIGRRSKQPGANHSKAPKIAPYWDDLCTGSDGKVHYKLVGTAPNRKLVVEWLNMKITRNGTCTGAVGNGTFQAWLHEPSHSTSPGAIQFVYGGFRPRLRRRRLFGRPPVWRATNFASVTTSVPSVSYTVANNTQLDAIAAGRPSASRRTSRPLPRT